MYDKIKVVGSFNVDIQAVIARVGAECDNFYGMVNATCRQLIEQNATVHYTHVYATAMLAYSQLDNMPKGKPRLFRTSRTNADASDWVQRKIAAAFAKLIDNGIIVSENGIVSLAVAKKERTIFDISQTLCNAVKLLSTVMSDAPHEGEAVKTLVSRKRELFAMLDQVKADVNKLQHAERARTMLNENGEDSSK